MTLTTLLRCWALLPLALVAITTTVAAASDVEPARSSLEFRLIGTQVEPVPIEVRRLSPGGRNKDAATIPFEAPGQLDLELETGTLWRYEVVADGYWSAPRLVHAGTETTVFELWPTVEVHGSLSVDAGETLPEILKIRFEPAAGKAKRSASPPPHELACPVDLPNPPVKGTPSPTAAATRGLFRCAIPAGTLDLRLRAPGFISHFLWSRDLPPGGTWSPGHLELRRGGSIVGRVALPEPGTVEMGSNQSGPGMVPSVANTRIELRPVFAGASSAVGSERQNRLRQRFRANEQGFFHLTDLSPGLYEITASKEGLGEASYPPLQVQENSESRLTRPLVLRPPVPLALEVHPPVDPLGRPWQVALIDPNRGNGLQTVTRGSLDRDGSWTSKPMIRQSYLARLLDGDGGGWWTETVSLHEVAKLSLSLDMIPIEGTVTLADTPLPATLWFGGRNGQRSLRMVADAEGRFQGVVPEGGLWRVDLQSRDPAVRRRLPGVTVEAGPDGVAQVAIDLQDFSLRGEVRDAEDQPTTAMLFLVGTATGSQLQQGWTEPDGTFEFRALDPGSYQIQAMPRGGGVATEREVVELSQDGESPFITLRFDTPQPFQGRVYSHLGPVPGAWVMVTPLRGDDMVSVMLPDVHTDSEGGFSLSLPPQADTVHLTVAAPGYALETRAVDLTTHQNEFAVVLERRGGTLLLSQDPPLSAANLWGQVTVLHNGIVLGTPLLAKWIRTHLPPSGPALTVPMLGHGEYTICPGAGYPKERSRLAEQGCTVVYLPPGGEIEIDLRQTVQTHPRDQEN